MKNVYRVIFCVGFTSHENRNTFQGILNARIPQLVTSLGLKTRIVSADMQLTGENEIGYEWFDQTTRVAIWASRVIVGFESEAERDSLFNALVAEYGAKDNKLSYFVDSQLKVGAFNKDVILLREPIDVAQVDVR